MEADDGSGRSGRSERSDRSVRVETELGLAGGCWDA